MAVTIYHNPTCGTSRNTLALIRQSGEEPDIVEYLKTALIACSSSIRCSRVGAGVRP